MVVGDHAFDAGDFVCGEEAVGVVREIDGCCGGVVLGCFGVRQAGVTVDREMQVGVVAALSVCFSCSCVGIVRRVRSCVRGRATGHRRGFSRPCSL